MQVQRLGFALVCACAPGPAGTGVASETGAASEATTSGAVSEATNGSTGAVGSTSASSTGAGGPTSAGPTGSSGDASSSSGSGTTEGVCEPPPKVGGSADLPAIRDVEFVNLPLADVMAGPSGYHIGVDVWIGDYVPGHHADDPFYGACVMATVGPLSYYKVQGPGDYPLGIFIDNENPNYCLECGAADPCAAWCDRCTPLMQHDWARKITGAALEIYAHDDDRGGLRLSVEGFENFANGGVYGPDLGVVSLPAYGAPGVAKLNGFAWSQGAHVGEGRLTVDLFHFGPAGATSTGYPVLGFGSTSTNQDGYYNPGPLLYGTYKTYLTDNLTKEKIVVYLELSQPDIGLDVDLDLPCFGQPQCEPP